MNISIIGSGWLAQPLAKNFQHDGHQVTLTTTQLDKVNDLKQQGFNTLQYNLGDQLSDPSELFNADVLIIAVTSKDIEAFDILMDQVSEYPDLNIIYISSTSVYQSHIMNNKQNHDETSTALDHDNPTWKIEQLIQTHPSASIIRFAGLVGPGRHPGRFFSGDKVIKNPQAPVNLIHLDDCIGIIKAVIKKAAWNQIFNGCADTHPAKAEFYSHATALIGNPPPATASNSESSYKYIENQKVVKQLAYEFIYPDVFGMKYWINWSRLFQTIETSLVY